MKFLGIVKEYKNEIVISMNIIINKINFIKYIYGIKNDNIDKGIQIINNK